MTTDQFKTMSFWTTRQPHREFDLEFAKWRPEMTSWSPEIRMWGSEESNRIDISYDEGRVSHIEFRVELRALSVHFIETLAAVTHHANFDSLSRPIRR